MINQIDKESCIAIEKELLTKVSSFRSLTEHVFKLIRSRSLKEKITAEEYSWRLSFAKNIISRLGEPIFANGIANDLDQAIPVLSYQNLTSMLLDESSHFPFNSEELESVAFEYRKATWMQYDFIDYILVKYFYFQEAISYKQHISAQYRLKKEAKSSFVVILVKLLFFVLKFLGYFSVVLSILSFFTTDLLQLFFVAVILSTAIMVVRKKGEDKPCDIKLLDDLLGLAPFFKFEDFNPVILENELVKKSVSIRPIAFALIHDQKKRFLDYDWRNQ
ncbi:hypothetical protein [Desulfobaculum bizertense]|uniref:Uncharacterized protein n=1 Tax=Desulfobaculum bizertense DSM 18034 TaxID=1121442 RepID=A0A1T4WR96_9BACT|nr:hypothetical protein [Desulfobaculum bizertense]SKA79836.1 hypothetical protein SAMN02745702_02581 [Desulfobaculum bizertense DSM 18034]